MGLTNSDLRGYLEVCVDKNIYLEDLKNFYPIWTKIADDLEIFSDFLDIVAINLN